VNATTSLHRWSVNLTDNQRGNLFPAGIRYQFSQFKKTGTLAFEQELQQVWVGMGYSVSQRLGFGLSGIYFSESTPNWVPDRSQAYGITVGSMYSFSPDLGLAISAQEIPVSNNQRSLMQNQLGIGLSYIYSYFLRTRIDLESGQNQNFDQPWVSMGFESLLSTWFAFRGGGKWQPNTSDWRSTLGFGLIGPRLSLNYAYIPSSRETDGALHALDLILPLW
jgi:hypothetical protein